MKSQTGKYRIAAIITVVMMMMPAAECRAEGYTLNPIEIGTLVVNTDSMNSKMRQQFIKEGELEIASYAQATQMSNITRWERKFSKYLSDARTYAQQAQAAYGIYTQTIKVLLNLVKLKKAIEANPSGIVASSLLTETYIKVADEVVLSFALMKQVFAKGGDNNMISGKERARVWWDLNDTLARLNDNLYRMAYNIAYYNLVDVWRHATQGILQRTNGTIANQALDRWKRHARVWKILND